jgi:hypothetical protein
MQTATFDPKGSAILVDVACDPQRDGSYDLILWEKDKNRVVREWKENFINCDDDRYPLPRPNSRNEGRLIEGMVVVAVPPGAGPSTISVTVSQDGRTLATEQADVPPNSPGALVDLFITLKRQA